MTRANASGWHQAFSEGRTAAADEERSTGSDVYTHTAILKKIVRSWSKIITAKELNMNRESDCLILTEDLKIRKLCVKMVSETPQQPLSGSG